MNRTQFPRILLLTAGGIFAVYGLACLLNPDLVARAAGLALIESSAVIEVQATYGGLQTMIGVVLVVFSIRREYQLQGLLLMIALIGGLAVGRSIGVAMHGLADAYTVLALLFEWTLTLLAAAAILMNDWTRQQPIGAGPARPAG